MEPGLTFLQHIMLKVTSFWTRSSQVKKRGWHTLHQNTNQSAWRQHWYFWSISWWPWLISGPDHRRWKNLGGTHYTRTQSKVHRVSIDISPACHADSGEFLVPDHRRWRNVGGTHYSRTQSKAQGVSIDISAACHADSGEILDQIIAGEETWVADITPEHKAKYMESALIFL